MKLKTLVAIISSGFLAVLSGQTFGSDITISPETGFSVMPSTPADRQKIKTVKVLDGVTEFPAGAFADCGGLREVTIPDTVTNVGEYAFANCTNLERLVVGAGVERVRLPAFPIYGERPEDDGYGLPNLRELVIGSPEMADAFYWEREWYDTNPAPLYSGSFADCIEKATDYSRGGCRFNQSGVVFAGLGTVADSLAAVRYLVDERKLVTLAELAAILKDDWKGHEDLRLLARRAAPKWGNNDDRADLAAKRVYDAVNAKVNATRNGHGGTFQAGWWSIYLDVSCGKGTGATPDGRKKGDPLSRNNVATDGCGKEGATALMLSNLKLDLAESPDGHIMDVLLPASVAKNPTGARDIADLIATYFSKGGQTLHLNCLDAKTLRDAQKHPERYADLQIRVCGWNVRWNDLSKAEQNHFIVTAEAQE